MAAVGASRRTPRVECLSLSALEPGPLDPKSLLGGSVVAHRAFNSSTKTAALVLSDGPGKVEVRLKGNWAGEASTGLQRVGKDLVLLGEGGYVEEVRDASGEVAVDERGWKKFRVTYARGLSGAWRAEDGKKGETFSFEGDPPAKAQAAPRPAYALIDSTNPHALPSSTSTSATQRRLASVIETGTTSTRLDDELLIPTADPSNPYMGVSTRSLSPEYDEPTESGKAEKRPADTYDASRNIEEPVPKKAKETFRKTWGLTVSQNKKDYLALGSLPIKNGGGHNLIACAFVHKAAAPAPGSRTGDWSTMLHLFDPTRFDDPVSVSYFGTGEANLPAPKDGDIVILQKLNWSKDRNWFVAYKDNGFFHILPCDSLLAFEPSTSTSEFLKPLPHCPCRKADITDTELSYARDLAKWAKKYNLVGNVKPSIVRTTSQDDLFDARKKSAELAKGARTKRPLLRIEEVQAGEFCDVKGEIVKFYNPHIIGNSRRGRVANNDSCQLFITDYTLNPQLIDYQSLSSVKVVGQYTLQISVYGAHNDPLLTLSEDKLEGRLVCLRNIRPKHNPEGFLEATMFQDPKFPERSDVTMLSHKSAGEEWLKQFKARRDTYWGRDPSERRLAPIFGLSKASEPSKAVDPLSAIFDTRNLIRHDMSGAVSLNSLGTFRFRGRVIDFKPDKLEEWVVAYCPVCHKSLAAGEQRCLEHDKVDLQWCFALVFEEESRDGTDEPCRILVQTNGQEASCLFPGCPPCQALRAPDPDLAAIAAFRDRFHTLLGSIELQKRSGSSQQTEDTVGPYTDIVVEGFRDEKDPVPQQMRWRFNRERTAFK
ncbi:hypothetical protein JCM21900_006612 [Sporobolomyces salmonicolor]